MISAPAITLHVQRPYRGRTPTKATLLTWITEVLRRFRTCSEITLRIVDIVESAHLNETWRQRPGPTNVLSFPAEGLATIAPHLLGDIVICAPLVRQEAAAQRKVIEAHWAHLVVHGTLHLLGYDHQTASAARTMELLEKRVLKILGFPDPYRIQA